MVSPPAFSRSHRTTNGVYEMDPKPFNRAEHCRRIAAHGGAVTAQRYGALTCYQRLNAGDEEGAKGGRVVTPETLEAIRETPYAAVQAVAEVVDWGGKMHAQAAAASALFGDGAKIKERAYRAAIKLVD
jgi:hypothetical protein